MKTILLATDGSPSAAKATSTAIELAQTTGWDLHVVTAWTIPVSTYGFAPMTYVPDVTDAERERAREVLDEAVEAARVAGLEPTFELRQGPPADKICEAAEDTSAALVVLGAHGWGAVKRLIFGSVSSAVLHHAPCPVLVVRADSAAVEPALAGAGSTTAS